MKSTYTGLAYAANSALPSQLLGAGLAVECDGIIAHRPYRDDQAVVEAIGGDGQLSKLQQLGDELCQARTGMEVAVEAIVNRARCHLFDVVGPMKFEGTGVKIHLVLSDDVYLVRLWGDTIAYVDLGGKPRQLPPHRVVDAIIATIEYEAKLKELEEG